MKPERARQTRTMSTNWDPASNFSDKAGALHHRDSQAACLGLRRAEGVADPAIGPCKKKKKGKKSDNMCELQQ